MGFDGSPATATDRPPRHGPTLRQGSAAKVAESKADSDGRADVDARAARVCASIVNGRVSARAARPGSGNEGGTTTGHREMLLRVRGVGQTVQK